MTAAVQSMDTQARETLVVAKLMLQLWTFRSLSDSRGNNLLMFAWSEREREREGERERERERWPIGSLSAGNISLQWHGSEMAW